MKYLKKIILISILTLTILPLFLKSRTAAAQEWTYNGANTERIQDFSVYPSECYIFRSDYLGTPDNESILEIVRGNISDTFMGSSQYPYPPFPPLTNGTTIAVNLAYRNITTDEIYWRFKNEQTVYWNGSLLLLVIPLIYPIDEVNGTVTPYILKRIKDLMDLELEIGFGGFEFNATYPNSYSIAFWNSTENKHYIRVNLTPDGILQKLEYSDMSPNILNWTLYSQPAQLPPDFSINTETESFTVNSTEFKLNITIEDADNNNDGEIDTDYLYRIQNGTEWTDWADVPNLLDWDLGDVEAGDYDIIIEVKNMYGVTQEEITIEYVPPKKKAPDFLPVIIAIIIICIVGVVAAITLILRRRIRGEKAVTKEIVDREIPSEKPEEPQVSEKIEDEP